MHRLHYLLNSLYDVFLLWVFRLQFFGYLGDVAGDDIRLGEHKEFYAKQREKKRRAKQRRNAKANAEARKRYNTTK